MKKAISILFIVFMIVGCAGLQKVADMVCNPTPEQQVTAAAMLAAIDAAQKKLGEFVPMANIIQASAVLNVIKAGGCFLISDLAAIFQTIDAANALTQRQAMMGKKMASPIALPEYAPLRKYLRK
jgi:hypothetical protein